MKEDDSLQLPLPRRTTEQMQGVQAVLSEKRIISANLSQ
jgi:hypothetical protein